MKKIKFYFKRLKHYFIFPKIIKVMTFQKAALLVSKKGNENIFVFRLQPDYELSWYRLLFGTKENGLGYYIYDYYNRTIIVNFVPSDLLSKWGLIIYK